MSEKKKEPKAAVIYMTLFQNYQAGHRIDYNIMYDAWTKVPADVKKALIDQEFGLMNLEGCEILYYQKEKQLMRFKRFVRCFWATICLAAGTIFCYMIFF